MPTVRLAVPEDLTHIMKFDSFPGDRINEIVDRRMLIVEVDGVPQGYVSWQTSGFIGKTYINKLVIDQNKHRQGLARLLVTSLGSILTGRIFISSPLKNEAAINLLKSTGWTKAGEIIGILPLDEAEVFFYREI